MKIVAFSDIHSPIYLTMFLKALPKAPREADIILMAGDIVDRNNLYEAPKIFALLAERYPNAHKFMVRGNNEWEETLDELKKICDRYNVRLLENEVVDITVEGKRIRIYGSKGFTDRLPGFEAKHPLKYSAIQKAARELAEKSIEGDYDIIIFLCHYGITYFCLEGEDPRTYPYLGSKRWEDILKRVKKRCLCIHGHAHKGKPYHKFSDNVDIYNVALPVNGSLVHIEV